MLRRLRRLCRLCRLPHLLLLLGLLRRLRFGLWPQRRHQRGHQVLCGSGGCIKAKQIPHAIILQPIVITLVPQLQLLLQGKCNNKRKKTSENSGMGGHSRGELPIRQADPPASRCHHSCGSCCSVRNAWQQRVFAMHGSSESWATSAGLRVVSHRGALSGCL